jgi:hypothetical protein
VVANALWFTRSGSYRQQFGEAEFVPVRIREMKETLALWRIARRLRLKSLRPQRPVMRVHVIDTKNHPTPPVACIAGRGDKIHECVARPKRAEGRMGSPIDHGKPELLVELG